MVVGSLVPPVDRAMTEHHVLCERCALCAACECGCHLEFSLRHRFMGPSDALKLEESAARILASAPP